MCFNQSTDGEKRQKAKNQNTCNQRSQELFFQMFKQSGIGIRNSRIVFCHIFLLVKIHYLLGYFMPFISVKQDYSKNGIMNYQNLSKIFHLFQLIQYVMMALHHFFHRVLDGCVFGDRHRLQSLRFADKAPDCQIDQTGQMNTGIFCQPLGDARFQVYIQPDRNGARRFVTFCFGFCHSVYPFHLQNLYLIVSQRMTLSSIFNDLLRRWNYA